MPDTHILDAFETLHGPQDWNQPHHCHVHGTHGWCEPCQAAIDHAANAGSRGAVKVVFDLRGEKRR